MWTPNLILTAAVVSNLAAQSEAFQPMSNGMHVTLLSPITAPQTCYRRMSSSSFCLHSGNDGDKLSFQSTKVPSQGKTEKNGWWKPLTAGILLVASTALAAGPALAAADFSSSVIHAQTRAWWGSLVETGFYQAFSLVFVSEIGDKTFFIAGLLAMKTSRLISFLGSMGALAVMTVISVLIGQIFHAVPNGLISDGIPFDDIAACLAFAFFGIKTLREALAMEEGESAMDDELAEAQETVDQSQTIREVTKIGQIASIFALVFAAEFGDRSFLSTIALSAAQNPVSVCAGGIAAHAVATGIAVSGGSYIAKYISEKVIGIIGGTLFIVFAVTTALGIF